jgi:hypothetical protein
MTLDKRNWMLAGAAIVLLFALAAVLASLSGDRRSDDFLRRPSTYFTDPSGARALLLVMRKLLPAAEQWRKPLTQLPLPDQPHAVNTLIVASPLLPLAKTEAAHLDRWLAHGGQLILASSDGWPVRQRAVNESGNEGTSEQENKPDVKKTSYLFTHAPALQWSKARRINTGEVNGPSIPRKSLNLRWQQHFSTTGAAKILAASDTAVLAVELPVGQGRIVAIADPTVLNNRALRAADNAVWLVTLAAAWGNGVTYFDEYHHGFGVQKSAVSLAWAFAKTPWGWCVGQIAAAGLLYIFVYRRRFGRISEAPAATHSNPLELVDARAGIFHAAGAQRLAAQSIMQNLSQELSQAHGRTIDVARVSEYADKSLAELQALAAKTERGEKLSDREFIQLGRLAGVVSKGRKP